MHNIAKNMHNIVKKTGTILEVINRVNNDNIENRIQMNEIQI